MKNKFIEICTYEVKPDKTEEFESLIKKVAKHHSKFSGTTDVKYMKRTHRQGSFNDVKSGKPAIRLTRQQKSVTYVLYWELNSTQSHGRATKSGLNKYYKEFSRCLIKMPKIILGERVQ